MKKRALILTCEHAVNTVPPPYQTLFAPFKNLLATHRGIDFGALEIALHLQKSLQCDFIQANTTRLLIDCNRSLNHPSCLSEVTSHLPPHEVKLIINQYYQPYRDQVINWIQNKINQGFQVLHLSIHSFTPVMNNEVRNTDVGLLYDPQRILEQEFCIIWKKQIQSALTVRRNYPYKGTSDGFTTFLRQLYADTEYLGIEVESNQALTVNAQSMNLLKNILSNSLLNVLS